MRMLLACVSVLAPMIALADAAETARRLDELYELRHQPQRLKELEALTIEALKTYASDGGILWRAAQLKHWQCDGMESAAMKKALGKAAWDYGEQAVKVAPHAVEAN